MLLVDVYLILEQLRCTVTRLRCTVTVLVLDQGFDVLTEPGRQDEARAQTNARWVYV
jgi:hypothetical protein